MRPDIYAFLFRLAYQLRNWRAHLRALVQGTHVVVTKTGARVENFFLRLLRLGSTNGVIIYTGALEATIIREDGRRLPLGTVSRRVITTAGVNYLRDTFAAHASGNDVQNFKYHDSGTGSVAEAIGDTDLGTAAGPTTRATGSQDNSVSKQYKTVGTISYTGTLAITEHGIFNQAARGAGTVLWDRSVFSAVNVNNGDSIQFTYTLSINDGG